MSGIHEQLSEQFYKWEQRGRRWQVFDEPIWPEPPFRPFTGYHLSKAAIIDDGRRPTILSSLVRKLSQRLSTAAPESPTVPTEEEPPPEPLSRETLVEFQISLPAKLDISNETFGNFLSSLSLCDEPIAFEIFGGPGRIMAQLVAHPDDAPLLRRQLKAYFPEALFQQRDGTLQNAWLALDGPEEFVIEFGLEREFMLPLAGGKIDPFIGIIGALSELETGELGLFQVLFQPTRHRWAESILNSVTGTDEKPFFVNAKELTDAAKTKTASPIFAAVVRIAAKGGRYDRLLQLTRDLAGSLRVFAHPEGNALIALRNDDYPSVEAHIQDVLLRQTHRTGMLLNSDELIGFVHLPSSEVRSPVLARDSGKTKAAPASVRHADGILLGDNVHLGDSVEVRLRPDHRVLHTHIIGASGKGKSTLLFHLIRQDIEKGDGIAVLDPHGDLIDRILGIIPDNRIHDVVLVDPSDEEFPVGFNILTAHSRQERTLLASDLVSVFRRVSTSWGDQMDIVLQNAILVFLDSPKGGTLAELRRFLIEPAFRAEFLKTVPDPELVYYWTKVFLPGNRSVSPVLARLQGFLSQPPIRNIVCQLENKLDFARIMDTGKIFLARLPEGYGEENSWLLGTLLVSKFQQIAMSRQSLAIKDRKDFWLYIDEFDNFITPTMAKILKGARKYRLGLTLAHQELHQLRSDPTVESAVATHPCTRIVFQVGNDDAKRLAENFSSFGAASLTNIPRFHAITRVEQSDCDFNLTIRPPEKLDAIQVERRRQEVITASRKEYAAARDAVEAAFRANLESAIPSSDRSKVKHRETTIPSPPEMKSVPHVADVPKTILAKMEAVAPAVEKYPAAPVVFEPAPTTPKSFAVQKRVDQETDPGRGGHQHRIIQRRIKEFAESIGFLSTREKEILDGKGSVDVLLERSNQIIACEIAITRTVDEEVGNVAKCLKAGFEKVAVLAVDKGRLQKLSSAISSSLGAPAIAHVKYYLPEELIEELRTMPIPALPSTSTVRLGWNVTRSKTQLSPEEEKRKQDAAYEVAVKAIQRPKKQP